MAEVMMRVFVITDHDRLCDRFHGALRSVRASR
jgi:hypothetical protein